MSSEVTSVGLRDLLVNDPLALADAELRRREGLVRFAHYLPPDAEDIWPRTSSRFVAHAPWRYWDAETVDACLDILERSVERTAAAISAWSAELGTGFEGLLHPAPAHAHEISLRSDRPGDLVMLATELHPEYLRRTEHVFGNLLTVYSGVLRKGGVRGKFTLRGAADSLKAQGLDLLQIGYDETLRNGIAHGQVVFTGSGARYGTPPSSLE